MVMSPFGSLRYNSVMKHYYLLVAASCLSARVLAADVKPQDDFDGFMQQRQQQEIAEAAYRQKLADHEIWRQSTWGGWAVRKMQEVAKYIQPFATAVIEAMKDQETGDSLSPTKLLLYVGLRVYVVVVGLVVIYALSRLLQTMIGDGDIVMEEEVVIVHQHETEEEAAKSRARAAQTRGKKQKDQ